MKESGGGVGIMVWTGTSWETFDVLDRGKAQYAEIELSNGMVLNCDTRHEVLVVGKNGYEFRHFNDLDEDTDVCVSIPTIKEFGEYPQEYHYTSQAHNGKDLHITKPEQWDFIAYLMGYVIGDGGIRAESRQAVTISFGVDKLKKYLGNVGASLEDLGLCFSKVRKTVSAKGESYQVQINSKGLVDLFIELGYISADSRNKRVPDTIFRSPISMRKSFLKGYFDTDGCKKRRNRYGYHTPNDSLLRDVQTLGWTLGLPSIVRDINNGNFKLEWQDLRKFEDTLDLPPTLWKRRNVNNSMLLPEFLRDRVKSILYPVYNRKDGKECAYFCKLSKGRKVTIAGMLSFMGKYNKELSGEVYYHYKLKRKTVLAKEDNTYTLSVHSDLHRFDSSGIISKNTGADVIKIALWRVYKWIYENNLQDDVKILLPVHDEILFEVREEKMDMIVPELCRIMKIRDVTDKLKWDVPLEVDAEYGDSFHVDHDFWKEMEAKMKEASSPVPVMEVPEIPQDDIPEVPDRPEKPESVEPVKKEVEERRMDSGVIGTPDAAAVTTNEAQSYYQNVVLNDVVARKEVFNVLNRIEEKTSQSLFKDAKMVEHIDNDGYFNYPIEMNLASAHKIRFILETIRLGNNLFIGPKNKLCLMSKDGEIFYRSSEEISVDAFLSLCIMFSV
jgi:hypothetical protein